MKQEKQTRQKSIEAGRRMVAIKIDPDLHDEIKDLIKNDPDIQSLNAFTEDTYRNYVSRRKRYLKKMGV